MDKLLQLQRYSFTIVIKEKQTSFSGYKNKQTTTTTKIKEYPNNSRTLRSYTYICTYIHSFIHIYIPYVQMTVCIIQHIHIIPTFSHGSADVIQVTSSSTKTGYKLKIQIFKQKCTSPILTLTCWGEEGGGGNPLLPVHPLHPKLRCNVFYN